MQHEKCSLPYPERFTAAARFWNEKIQGVKAFALDLQLLLYSLHQQATVGPNNTPKPWGWGVEGTKWQGWKELGSMSKMEAMRLFVKTLDEEQPNWWGLLQAHDAGHAPNTVDVSSNGTEETAPAPEVAAASQQPLVERTTPGAWQQVDLPQEQRRPIPRYEQGAALLNDNIYVVGGNYGGRYLSDVWCLDLGKGVWSQLQLQPQAGPANGANKASEAGALPGAGAGVGASTPHHPSAGHSVTAWQGQLLVLGGHVKAKSAGSAAMSVRVLDPTSRVSSPLHTQGTAPSGRGGHTATLIGGKVWVFGGEDASRRALADLHTLDLTTSPPAWSQPAAKGAKKPSARSAAGAVALEDRYLVVFGGGSVATCYSDVWVLDTHTLEWSQAVSQGAQVTPRAGHSAAVLDNTMYVVGGGNNVKGCTDLLAADLSAVPSGGPVTWHVVASVQPRDPLSSEGISLVAVPSSRALIAFGGYNGKYQNVLSVYRSASPSTRDEAAEAATAAGTAPPAAAAAATDESSAAPAAPEAPPAKVDAVAELKATISELKAQLEAARKDAEAAIKDSAEAKDGAAQELALLRKQLVQAQAAASEANKAADEARALLSAEQSKTLKLEAQLAEAHTKLSVMAELEREMAKYRREAKEAEAKKGGGLWSYFGGGGASNEASE